MLKVLNKSKLDYIAGSFTVEQVLQSLNNGHPVIIDLQAHSELSNPWYEKTWDDGHYVIAIGYGQGKLFFADPSKSNHRLPIHPWSYLTIAELEKRWHDTDKTGAEFINFGIEVGNGHSLPIKTLSPSLVIPMY